MQVAYSQLGDQVSTSLSSSLSRGRSMPNDFEHGWYQASRVNEPMKDMPYMQCQHVVFG
jgi:hypothetical protein